MQLSIGILSLDLLTPPSMSRAETDTSPGALHMLSCLRAFILGHECKENIKDKNYAPFNA